MAAGEPSRILFIDDDPGLRRLVQRDLERRGCTVVTAADGPEGLRLAAAGPRFAAICLDHYMPGEDGLAILPRLLALPEPSPVVFVTGSEEGRIAVAALRAGAADYVIKEPGPDFPVLLAAAIEGAIERETLRREKAAAEQAVREALTRAEELAQSRAVLLREVNHRVANSLQLISSLARMQESAITDPGARHALSEMRNRIAAVAQVHRRLYTSDDVRSVALDGYLAGLLDEIARSAGAPPIELCAEPLRVPPDRAVSLGVIVSELVTNAMKYAYPGGSGPIRVRLTSEAGAALLEVVDEGVGLGNGGSGSGLGGRVVAALAGALGGAVQTT
ncbi:MAG TPA: histidine kinase dimerization/phosphoacceptor domain -containing protein, partial [Crenalkalicoccus sp.]|nr:histidine kinase dimerization/phosphoacceptor domain -containing protein [Crenalkalicoccus sp.]